MMTAALGFRPKQAVMCVCVRHSFARNVNVPTIIKTVPGDSPPRTTIHNTCFTFNLLYGTINPCK